MAAAGRRRLLRWAVTIPVLALVTALFARTLSDNWDQVREEDVAFDWRMVVAVVLFAVAVPVSGALWGRIVNQLSTRPVSTIDAVAVHCSSWLLKYVPGQVGSVLNKVTWGQRRGISRTLVLITFIYENVFLQLVSIVPTVAILLVATGFGVFGDNASTVLLPLLILVPLVVIANRRWFRAILSLATRRILKSELPDELFLPTAHVLRYLALFAVPRILNGIGFVLVVQAFDPVGADTWLPLGASYVLAGAIGILAVFVPSGLGVRESIIVVFASEYVPTSQAILIAVVVRLLTVIADLGVLLAYGAALAIQRREQPA